MHWRDHPSSHPDHLYRLTPSRWHSAFFAIAHIVFKVIHSAFAECQVLPWSEHVSYLKHTYFLVVLCLWHLRWNYEYGTWVVRELDAAGSLLIPPEPLGTAPGSVHCYADGLRKLIRANAPFLCSSVNCCPILMLLRSGDSRLILLIHSPDPLVEHRVQISLKYKGNWIAIQIKWAFCL